MAGGLGLKKTNKQFSDLDITKNDLGLENVNNTSDLQKPTSNQTLNLLDDKVDKVANKGLSTNNFTNQLLDKLTNLRQETPASILSKFLQNADAEFFNTRLKDELENLQNIIPNKLDKGSFTGTAENIVNIIANLTLNDIAETNIKKHFTSSEKTKISNINDCLKLQFTDNYNNLQNNFDNIIRFDKSLLNTNTDLYRFVNNISQNVNQVIRINETGIYEVKTKIRLFDLTGNVDLLVKLFSGTDPLNMRFVGLLSDSKFDEMNSDRLVNGHFLLEVENPDTYVSIGVNPSDRMPFPSAENKTPSEIIIKKVL